MKAGTSSTAVLCYQATFTPDQDQELAEKVLRLVNCFLFGLTRAYFSEKYNFPEADIYNVDETDMSTIQNPRRI
jgi:hypothetical protein